MQFPILQDVSIASHLVVHLWEESDSIFSTLSHEVAADNNMVSSAPPVLQAEQAQLFQPFIICHMLVIWSSWWPSPSMSKSFL